MMNPFNKTLLHIPAVIAFAVTASACSGGNEASEPAGHAAGDTQTRASEGASQAAGEVANETLEQASQTTPPSAADVKAALAAAEEAALDAAENAKDTVSGKVETVAANADALRQAVGDGAEAASEKVSNVMNDVAGEVSQRVDDAVTSVSEEGASLPSGDVIAGKRVFVQCMACHTVQEGQNRVGPSLYGIVGRAAGAVEGFNYSEANKTSDVVWSPEVLFDYLEDPRAFMPGTTMIFAGIPSETRRTDLIAYLQSVGG